jgi:hypothetical protein
VNERRILEQWRKVVASIDAEIGNPAKWASEPPGYFLHVFRPDGARLKELFDDLPGTRGVLARLRDVFDVAGADTGHLQFIPSKRRALREAEAIGIAREHFERLAVIAEIDEGSAEGGSADAFLLNPTPIEVRHGRAPSPSSSPLADRVYDIVTGAARVDHRLADLLSEPVYMMTCTYEMVGYVTWPLDESPELDPFESWFRIWAASGHLSYENRDGWRAIVYLP